MQFKGKTFIVTGGASGIGEKCVRLLASFGASIKIGDRNVSKGESLANGAQEEGWAVEFFQLDLED